MAFNRFKLSDLQQKAVADSKSRQKVKKMSVA